MLTNYHILFKTCFISNKNSNYKINKEGIKNKQRKKNSLLIRGFYLYLSYNICIEKFNPVSLIRLIKELPFNNSLKYFWKNKQTLYLPVVWSQWVKFFNIVCFLKNSKVIFFYEGQKNLNFFIKALSWFSWSLSFVTWKFFYFNNKHLHQINKPMCLINLNVFKSIKCPPKGTPVLSIGNLHAFWASWSYLYTSVFSKNFQIFFLSYFSQSII